MSIHLIIIYKIKLINLSVFFLCLIIPTKKLTLYNHKLLLQLPEHTVKLCNYLSNKNSKFQDCCQEKTPTDVFVCVYFMPAAQPPELPDVQMPTEKDICGKVNTKAMDQ